MIVAVFSGVVLYSKVLVGMMSAGMVLIAMGSALGEVGVSGGAARGAMMLVVVEVMEQDCEALTSEGGIESGRSE